MDQSPASGAVLPARVRDQERLLDAFETAWQSGPPQLDDFLPAAGPAADGSGRRALLEELVRIDLDYRWQSVSRSPGPSARPRLEEYLARYPELGQPEPLSLELIGEEYEVRQHHGDRPDQAEYLARFPEHGGALRDTLARIDARLADEFATPGPCRSGAGPVAVPSITPGDAPADLRELLRHFPVLSPDQDAALESDREAATADSRGLARLLLQRDWLTPYQVNLLLQGRGADLFLGAYLLLTRLGEGGAGQVFKARHQKMGRLVALKVIRRELVADAEAVGRFRREIQILSRLDHPNVVHAYDAGVAGASQFLAMEYVEGTDLARLVKGGGPLPVQQACAYIRQAALGLQHAHERGLVHRDIKPHNLILSLREGRIKVADLGLARLPHATSAEVTAAITGSEKGSSLTPVGAVLMGTADYLAPEQALDFHKADIRADIYSLGCTLWYVLTGQPPFPVDTLAEKLLSHQSKDPPAIKKLRPDVPAGLAGVLQRMLEKRPEDRYPTPGAVAEALLPYSHSPDEGDLEFDSGGWSFRTQAATTWTMLRKFARRNKAFTAAVLAALVLLAWSSLANYQARRDTERVNQQLREERQRTRESVPAFVLAARRAVDLQDFPQALKLVDTALRYDPECAQAGLLRGQMLIVLRDFAQARQELERYRQQQPADRNAEWLIKLCTRERPDTEANLLELAYVFEREQRMPALAEGLLRPMNSLEARKRLLATYQERLEKCWGKRLAQRLTLDPNGLFRLNLAGCAEEVADLEVLRGIPLTALDLLGCQGVKDLTPLKDMPLTWLNLRTCGRIENLAPLTGMRLTMLDVAYSGASDLSVLRGMPLRELYLQDSKVTDLSRLAGVNLAFIMLPGRVDRGMKILRAMTDLKTIDRLPAEEFWQKYRAGEFKDKYKE